MAKKKGAGGKPQAYDESSGRYVADYTALGTQELRERQIIEIPANAEHPPVEKAFGFNRLDTKHHQRHAREMGFKIGLHTSGCYPGHLKEVIHLVDWVGLDVKASICDAQAYRWITGIEKSDPARNVSGALQIIQDAHVTYECRTTAHPDYLPDEKILKLAHELKDRAVDNFALQIYRKPKELELPFENVGHEYPESETIEALKVMFKQFELRRE